MYNIELYGIFIKIMEIFHYFGVWMGNEDETSSLKRAKKLITLFYYILFLISVASGAYLSEDRDDSMFLSNTTVTIVVLTIKLYYMCWQGKIISTLLHNVSRHSISSHTEFIQISNQLENFVKFAKGFMLMVAVALITLSTACLPVFSSHKNLPFNIAFPLDWRTSEISYWITYAFVAIGTFMAFLITCFNIIVWYIMLNCSIKYQLLGARFRSIGEIKSEKTTFISTDKEKEQKAMIRELISLIKIHQSLEELMIRVKLLFSHLFLIIITASGILICSSIYMLAFSENATLVRSAVSLATFLHNTFDIFMVMNYGNEIKLNSDRLSYSLFESNSTKQSTAYKKYVIILTEILNKPHEIVIFKLFRLNLEAFTSILNLAYSMFNILKKFS